MLELLEGDLGNDRGQERDLCNRSIFCQQAQTRKQEEVGGTDADGEAGREADLAEAAELVEVLEGRDDLKDVQQRRHLQGELGALATASSSPDIAEGIIPKQNHAHGSLEGLPGGLV